MPSGSTRVVSRGSQGRDTWVATFNHLATANAFVEQMNRIYHGHLTFRITDSKDN